MSTRVNWSLVVNAEGTILAVYGSALADEARAKARELSALGPVELRLVATTTRLRVGAQIGKRSLSLAFLVACLTLGACSAATPAATCPPAERGAWTVAWQGTDATGRPILVTADICDEQTTSEANETTCRDRADAFNAERREKGDLPIYFVTWSEE